MKSIYKQVLLAALMAAAGVTGFAQGMGPMGGMGGPMAGPHDGMRPGMHQRDPAKMQEMMAKRLNALKAKLKISPEQEGAWSTFAASAKPPANQAKRPDPAEMQKLTTPERIDKMRALHAERQVEMDKRAEALKTFYATLTPEQKKVMDAEPMHHGRRGEGRGPRGAGKDVSPATK
jgi:hypothetical protein